MRTTHATAPAGFTLMEMMIVVTILAIVASMALPMFGATEDARLRAAARLLLADLEFAQMESMTHGEDPRILVLEPAAARYRIAAASDPDTPLASPLGGAPYVVEYGVGRADALAGVTISAHDLDGDDRLGFRLYGQTDQLLPATITLRAGARTVTVTVDPDTGEATVGAIE